MSRPRVRLPLPSRCRGCGTTIHAIRNSSKEKLAPEDRIIWVHDAALAVVVRKAGPHSAAPDPTYAPQRAHSTGYDVGRAFRSGFGQEQKSSFLSGIGLA